MDSKTFILFLLR